MITYRNKLDMTPGGVPLVINLSQYDSDFTLIFDLFTSNGDLTIESGTTVGIRGTKTDGNGYSVAASISSNAVTVTGDQQMTAVPGNNIFELTLYKNSKELNTANFILKVEDAALDKDNLASGSTIRELVDVIDNSAAIIAAGQAVSAGVAEMQQLRNDAVAARQDAGAAKEAVLNIQLELDQALEDYNEAVWEAVEEVNQAVSDATDEFNRAANAVIETIQHKGEQIQSIATNADQVALQALDKAGNAENHMAALDNAISELRTQMDDVSIDPDDLGLYQDSDTGYVYPTYRGVVSENGIPLASSGGGGGGGGEVINAQFNCDNTSGFLAKTISSGSACPVTFSWSSIENEIPTGDGTVRITVNDVVRTVYQVQQGNIAIDLGPYLGIGSNKVKVRISDVYDQAKTTTFSITSIELGISSSFDTDTVYTGGITFPYTPVGAVAKTVYFYLDNHLLGTQETSVSNRQMTYTIAAQAHGSHTLRVYFEATINNETVRSNELYYEFIAVDPLSDAPIIASNFHESTADQYETINIPYRVYTPNSLMSAVSLYVGNAKISDLSVDRTEHTWSYRADNAGSLTLSITTGNIVKTFTLTVAESEIDVEAETDSLVLYLTSTGRSNSELNPGVWEDEDNDISCVMTDFNFVSDGWISDSDGYTALRVSGDARVTIPYQPFANDFRGTGKTIEIEFAVHNVLDYSASILSCFSGGRGLTMTPQLATIASEQSTLSAQFKEDEHIRISFAAEKRSEDRLFLVFINGIPSGVVQYPTNDDFSQVSPVNISIGSNYCTLDIYNIRIYDNDLTRHQILTNWIADTQDISLLLERYSRNLCYDAYGNIVVDKLPNSLPYYILSCPELPQYKGDKKTIYGSFVNPLTPSKSFTFTGCQINVQGTSSAPYYRKNYDMQFKNGFELNTGHAEKYQLQTGDVPFNRFVLKADVASSEGANNVELVRLYNDACPYKTPEMEEDSRIRWGIDGFPIVVFWNNTATGETSFLGKYNFNLPKRAPEPYGYGNDDEMESWEFQNNTSELMVFQSDYFDETPYTDPDTGDTKELWRYDYEARFPSDEWTDYTILQEFQSFVYSTYREEATGDALPSSVTYDGVTYTNDTAAYRLAKFRVEFPSYAELNSFLFYYIFTELFLMVDSRAKNLFIGFNGSAVTVSGRAATRKATAQPYDMDTAIGTNNEGSLVFTYSLEDTDHLAGGVNIFNGQNSVLWCNLRDAFETEIRQMYQTLRSEGTLSYSTIEERYEVHQSKWPEAIWIEDSWFKYLYPLIHPDPGKEATGVYLPMMQGSKEQQRKWWLFNRFKYMDSKWTAGEAISQVIQLRAYAQADITVTPYTDIYPTIRYASYTVQRRGQAAVATTLPCPLTTLNDTEIYVYSAPQIKSVGDLSALQVGFADFSYATKIQSIKLGDSDSNYDNTNLYALTFGSNRLLKTLDVRNCSGFGDTSLEGHTQTTVDLSGCEIIENVYFDGTKVRSVTLPNGGVLKVLHLPATITNLTIMNQSSLTDFRVDNDDYSNITTLRIENCSSAIPVLDILDEIPANSRVRLIGFTATASTTAEVEDFYDYLDTMRGLDENGGNLDNAVVSGTITGLGTITGAWLAEMNARYPNITIEYEHISSYLRYYNGDTLYYTETITDGGNGVYAGTPSKASTAQYSYTFTGWSKTDDNTVDVDARQAVTADRNVYACYSSTVRTYTVTWKNANGTVLETDSNVPYGTTPTYNGATPTQDGQSSTGWTPAVGPVTGDTIYTAVYTPIYTITFVRSADDGGGTLWTGSFQENTTPVYGGSTPTTTRGDSTEFEFGGWDPALAPATANATYTAKFLDKRSDVVKFLERTLTEYEG